MKYILKISALGKFPELKIEKERFDKLKEAKEILNHGFAIEEKYEILIQNYLDLENTILDVALKGMIQQTLDYEDFFDIRLILNRRIVNLLTSTKLYYDQVPVHVRSCLPSEVDIIERIRKIFSVHYDKHIEYRFMEALRNYVQHRGIAIHNTNIGGKHKKENGNLFYKNSVEFYSHKKILLEDKKFKRGVAKEIGDVIDLKLAIRVYIASFSDIHHSIRGMVGSHIDTARSIFDSASNDYLQISCKKPTGLKAMAIKDDDSVNDEIAVFTGWDDVRSRLKRKNCRLNNLEQWYVSGEIDS